MEKFAYLSDVHFDYMFKEENGEPILINELALKETIRNINTIEADYLLIAGDIAQLKHYKYIFQYIKPKVKDILVVAGNHEYWDMNLDKIFHIPSNIKLLTSDITFTTEQGIIIKGDTLWTKIPDEYISNVSEYMPEYRSIINNRYFSPIDTNEWNKVMTEKLFQQDVDIVICHHAPSFKSKPHKSLDWTDYIYYNDLDEIIESTNIKKIIHGHTHKDMNYMIGDTNVLAHHYKSDNICSYFEL